MATDTRPYADENRITAGLLALIASGGNARAAARSLVGTQHEIPHRTLVDWRHRYAERYLELHEQHAPDIERALTAEVREIALDAFNATRIGISQTREKLEAGELKDPAGATRNLATTGAIAADKLLALTGRPTSITEHRNPDDVLAKLQDRGIIRTVEAQATEIHEDPTEGVETRQLAQTRTTNAQDQAA